MEHVMVSAATGVMSAILAKLTEMLGDKYKLVKGVRKDIEFLKSELCTMKGVLDTMADAEELDPLDKIWRDTVREMSYDIEDCIDISLERLSRIDDVTKSGLVAKVTWKLNKLRMSYKIARDIQELKARVVAETKRRNRYSLDIPLNRPNASVKVDPRMCALWVEKERLIGIDGPTDKLIGWLMPERDEELPQQVTTLSIVGCGGLGKTTLANQVYLKIKGEFQCAAFVTVSQRPIIKSILMDICSQVGAIVPRSDNVENLICCLREHLQHKRYCVVVDDMWEPEPWKFIGAALVKNCPGSIIIITTRIKDVAKSCHCSHGGRVHEMDCLNDSDSKRLFFTRIFGYDENCPPELVHASEEILSKCKGIPLAISVLHVDTLFYKLGQTSISSLLTVDIPQSVYHWNKVKECISSRVPGSKYLETMQSVLALSYFNLPHDLRGCLLYLSAFPEDCVISRDRLVTRWIAEGLISARQEETLYEAGVRYFNMLVNRSLIQPCYEYNGEVLSCRIHDVILNFIVSKSVEENFITLSDPSGILPSPAASKVRRLLVHGRYEDDVVVPWKTIKPHVRSLASSDIDCKYLHPLSEFEVLRVLDLEGCKSLKDNHLISVQKLVQLRYLGIRRTNVSELPASIGEARHLETLDIRDTEVIELPSGIALLQRLVRLLVGKKVKFPAEGVSKMKALEHLGWVSISLQPPSFLKELGKLTKLRVLDVVCHCNILPDKTNEYLKILASSLDVLGRYDLGSLIFDVRGVSDAFMVSLALFPALETLRNLYIWDTSIVPNWVCSLVNLECLDLRAFEITQDDLRMLGGMPALEALQLCSRRFQDRQLIIRSSDGFQRLKLLRMGTQNMLFMPGSAPHLKDLRMGLKLGEVGCDDSGIQHLPNLIKVHVFIIGSHRSSVERKEVELRNIVNGHLNRPVLTVERYVSED